MNLKEKKELSGRLFKNTKETRHALIGAFDNFPQYPL
jgi:hypothetical protein